MQNEVLKIPNFAEIWDRNWNSRHLHVTWQKSATVCWKTGFL